MPAVGLTTSPSASTSLIVFRPQETQNIRLGNDGSTRFPPEARSASNGKCFRSPPNATASSYAVALWVQRPLHASSAASSFTSLIPMRRFDHRKYSEPWRGRSKAPGCQPRKAATSPLVAATLPVGRLRSMLGGRHAVLAAHLFLFLVLLLLDLGSSHSASLASTQL